MTVISLVRFCEMPKCLARQVTRWWRSMMPEVTPDLATACSPKCMFPARWTSTLLARSKQRSMGASICVISSSVTMLGSVAEGVGEGEAADLELGVVGGGPETEGF